jgi:hypothetical protein
MNSNLTTERKRGPAMEILILTAVFVGWIILQAWVLPRFGVKT